MILRWRTTSRTPVFAPRLPSDFFQTVFSFHHVALSVSDLERSAEFYAIFGFKPVVRWQADDASLRIWQLKNGSAMLELFCYAEPQDEALSARDLASDLPRLGIRHFGVRVDNLQSTLAELKQQGLADNVSITHGRTGIDYFFLRDPDGIFVEVVQDDRKF